MIIGQGGLVSYLGTNSVKNISKRIEDGDNEAKEILKAMCYQTAKFIGSMAVSLNGIVDAILLTGGAAYSDFIVKTITEYVSFISEVKSYPGEDEMLALAQNGYRALSGEVEIKEYKPL